MNKVHLMGRMVNSPVFKKFSSTSSSVCFILACPRKPYKDGQAKADFIPCIAWNKLAKVIYDNFNKGQAILVSGSWRTERFVKNGVNCYVSNCVVTDFEFIGSKADNLKFDPTYDKTHDEGLSDADFKRMLDSIRLDDLSDDFFND